MIAWYLKDRSICEQKTPSTVGDDDTNEVLRENWVKEWSELYPTATRTVLYQALIFAGEHNIAREIRGGCECIVFWRCHCFRVTQYLLQVIF